MKNTILKISALLLLLSLASCKKNVTREYKVHIVEYGTQKPIANARVDLHKYESSEGGGWTILGGAMVKINEFYTDNNGYTKISIEGNDSYQIRVFTEGRDYFDYNLRTDAGEYLNSKYLNPVIEIYPVAYVKLKVNWSVFEGEFDYLQTNRLPGCPSVGCLFTFNSDTITNSNRIFGNANNELIIWGYKAGQKAQMIFNYDVYSPAFDTTIYTLNR